jgi:tetratricopeptide (TPR) repeat protein
MDYTIDEQRVEVIAHIKKLGDFRYGSSGEFLESAALEDACLKKGDYSTVILTAEAIVKRGDATLSRLKEVLFAIQRARREGANDDRGWKAAALKVEGLVREASGESDQALVLYQQALDINPKIGLKRKVVALQKALRE